MKISAEIQFIPSDLFATLSQISLTQEYIKLFNMNKTILFFFTFVSLFIVTIHGQQKSRETTNV